LDQIGKAEEEEEAGMIDARSSTAAASLPTQGEEVEVEEEEEEEGEEGEEEEGGEKI
jgi:hypothetical protein